MLTFVLLFYLLGRLHSKLYLKFILRDLFNCPKVTMTSKKRLVPMREKSRNSETCLVISSLSNRKNLKNNKHHSDHKSFEINIAEHCQISLSARDLHIIIINLQAFTTDI